jgi:hypothetical protein
MYILHKSGLIIRLSDNVFIPPDKGNKDYREYLSWIEEGNIPQEMETLHDKEHLDAQIKEQEIQDEIKKIKEKEESKYREQAILNISKRQGED